MATASFQNPDLLRFILFSLLNISSLYLIYRRSYPSGAMDIGPSSCIKTMCFSGIGDFLTVARLAQSTIQALLDSREAAGKYYSLVELLRSIAESLSTITAVVQSSLSTLDPKLDTASMNGLAFHSEHCRQLMLECLVCITSTCGEWCSWISIQDNSENTPKGFLMDKARGSRTH
jgi:hypothetical protein